MQVIIAILTINLVYCNSLLTVIKDYNNVLKLTRRYKVADSLMNHVNFYLDIDNSIQKGQVGGI